MNMKAILAGSGSVLATALLVTVVAPKPAHAMVAALVQVANTWTSPVITTDPARAASQQVLLQTPRGGTLVGGQQTPMVQFNSTHVANPTPYVVPAGQQLVVTGIDLITGTDMNGPLYLSYNGYPYEVIDMLPQGMHQLQFPQGIVYPSGSSVVMDNTNGNSSVQVIVRGYLTAI